MAMTLAASSGADVRVHFVHDAIAIVEDCSGERVVLIRSSDKLWSLHPGTGSARVAVVAGLTGRQMDAVGDETPIEALLRQS